MQEMVQQPQPQQEQQQQQQHIPSGTITTGDTSALSSVSSCCRLCSHKDADVVVRPCGCHIHAVSSLSFCFSRSGGGTGRS
eukprot:scaffold6007_cov183-Amphora_coffeaeformis.AAC.15